MNKQFNQVSIIYEPFVIMLTHYFYILLIFNNLKVFFAKKCKPLLIVVPVFTIAQAAYLLAKYQTATLAYIVNYNYGAGYTPYFYCRLLFSAADHIASNL